MEFSSRGFDLFLRRRARLTARAWIETRTTRDYRQNAASLVAVQPRDSHPQPHALPALAAALREPRFTLYLGRKACPPAAPLWPQVITAESAKAAFAHYAHMHEAARQAAADKRGRLPLEALLPLTRLAFDDHMHAGVVHGCGLLLVRPVS